MKYNKDILDRFITEKVAINVETQQEWNDFMKLLEKETKCRWGSRQHRPTELKFWYHEETSIIFNHYRHTSSLEYCGRDYYQSRDYEVIKYRDLIKGETMKNIEKVNKALENADEDKIKEVLDFLGYKEDGKFIPEYEERYYFINAFGDIDFNYWVDGKYDEYRLLMNNVYRTEEEAKQALDFQTRKAKLIKEIEDSSEPMDFSDENQGKYLIWLDGCNNALLVSGDIQVQTQGRTYTTNFQFLEELIKERSDEVKELLFGIKL